MSVEVVGDLEAQSDSSPWEVTNWWQCGSQYYLRQVPSGQGWQVEGEKLRMAKVASQCCKRGGRGKGNEKI